MSFIVRQDGTRVEVSPAVKGSISEHVATAWLLRNGYDVFRNVSPVGRADLVAKKWDEDDFVVVDVKSEGFDLDGLTPMAEGQRLQAAKYSGHGIRYLVVSDDGHRCRWWDEIEDERRPADNDNHWVDPKTGQRFLHPRNDMSKGEWSYFCTWLLGNHGDKLTEAQKDFIVGLPISDRARGRYGVRGLLEREKEMLKKIHWYVHGKLAERCDASDEAA